MNVKKCLKVLFTNLIVVAVILIGILLLIKITTPRVAHGDEEMLLKNDYYLAYGGKFTEARVLDLITRKAKEYKASVKDSICVLRKESDNFSPDVLTGKRDGDTHLTCNIKSSENYGKEIRSRGIAQWNNCAHPNVPDVDAYDIEEAVELFMPSFIKNPQWWSTYKDCKNAHSL